MPETPAPLPREEIERLDRYVAEAETLNARTIRQEEANRKIRAMLIAALAESEAGRAGAERTRAHEVAYAAQSQLVLGQQAKIERLENELAALRQAAQPSPSANDWRHGACTHSAPYLGHCPKCGVALPADPAQAGAQPPDGAQPAGRVEAVARARRAIDALRKPDASLARVPYTIRQSIAEVIEDLIGTSPAPAGAGDGEEQPR